MSGRDIGVLLIDDDEMVRSWVRLALERTEFRIVGEAKSGAEAVPLAAARRPDVLLVDFRLPDGLGTELVRRFRREGVSAPALLMTAGRSPGLNEAVRDAGGQGGILKSGAVSELVDALRAVASRRARRGHATSGGGRSLLSPRERQVLRLVARGRTNREIAADLGVGPETVKTLLARAFAKLGAHRRAEAVATAQAKGLL
jgi:DNA-binding NarL/FixJ family response regulator